MEMRCPIAMRGHVRPDEHDTGLLGARSYFSGSLHALIQLDGQLEHQKEVRNVQGEGLTCPSKSGHSEWKN